MMTRTIAFPELLEEIRKFKPCSRGALEYYLKVLRIKPLNTGGRIRPYPRLYPGNTVAKIAEELGFDGIVGLRKLRAVRDHATPAEVKKARAELRGERRAA